MFTPYRLEAANWIYNLLFCDDPALFAAKSEFEPESDLARLVAPKVDAATLRRLAEDSANDVRYRALAFHRLRQLGETVESRVLLGTIVEVPLNHGLDTLAVFRDQSIRYINGSSKMVILDEPIPAFEREVATFLEAAKVVVNRLETTSGARLPPPPLGWARTSFIVSDGMVCGQAPFSEVSKDLHVGPLLQSAGVLINRIILAVRTS